MVKSARRPLTIVLAVVLCIALLLTAFGENLRVLALGEQIDLLFVVGQSNAAGYTETDYAYERQNSVACPEGQVFSSYVPLDDHGDEITGLSNLTTCQNTTQVKNYISNSVGSNTSRGNSTLVYKPNALSAKGTGTGKTGLDSGLAYQWNKLSNNKVWVTNISYGGTSIGTWGVSTSQTSNYAMTVEAMKEVIDTVNSDSNYRVGNIVMFWFQGESDTTGSYADKDKYANQFISIVDGMRKEVSSDMKIGVYLPLAMSSGVDPFTTDSKYIAPQLALQEVAAEKDYVYVASDVNLKWSTDSSTTSYFKQAYPDGYTYPSYSGLPVYMVTNAGCAFKSPHYTQVGHNENGIVGATNMYNSLTCSHNIKATTTWSDDYTSATMAFYCDKCNYKSTSDCTVDVSKSSSVSTESCGESTTEYYTATAKDAFGTTHTDKVTIALSTAGEHTFGKPEFTWSSDYSTCTATYSCTKCSQQQTVNCMVTSESTATCQQSGTITYTATAEYKDMVNTDTKKVDTPATDHNYNPEDLTINCVSWNFPTEWSDSYKTSVPEVTATFTCADCGEQQTVNASVVKDDSKSTEPSCKDGTYVYTATAGGYPVGNLTHSMNFSLTVPATGKHSYGTAPEYSTPDWDTWGKDWTWSSPIPDITAKLTCSICGQTDTYDCEVTIENSEYPSCESGGNITYRAVFAANGEIWEQTWQCYVDAGVHDYDVTFNWSPDYQTCTVDYVCTACGADGSASCNVNYTEKTASTCSEQGNAGYEATVTIDGRTYTDYIQTETLPLVNHTFSISGYMANPSEWDNILYNTDPVITAVATCNDCGYTETVNCNVYTEDSQNPTTESEGWRYYKAVPIIDGTESANTWQYFTYTIPALTDETEHIWGVPEFAWADNYAYCTVTAQCLYCDEVYTETVTPEYVAVAPLCDANGYEKYEAFVTLNGCEFSDIQTVILPPTGHKYSTSFTVTPSSWDDCLYSGLPTATATRYCAVCSYEEEVPATVVLTDFEDPTCQSEGFMTVEVHSIVDGVEQNEQNSYTYIVPMSGCKGDVTSFEWVDSNGIVYSDENNSDFVWDSKVVCYAVRTCSTCGNEYREECEITVTKQDDGSVIYSAVTSDNMAKSEITFNGNIITDVDDEIWTEEDIEDGFVKAGPAYDENPETEGSFEILGDESDDSDVSESTSSDVSEDNDSDVPSDDASSEDVPDDASVSDSESTENKNNGTNKVAPKASIIVNVFDYEGNSIVTTTNVLNSDESDIANEIINADPLTDVVVNLADILEAKGLNDDDVAVAGVFEIYADGDIEYPLSVLLDTGLSKDDCDDVLLAHFGEAASDIVTYTADNYEWSCTDSEWNDDGYIAFQADDENDLGVFALITTGIKTQAKASTDEGSDTSEVGDTYDNSYIVNTDETSGDTYSIEQSEYTDEGTTMAVNDSSSTVSDSYEVSVETSTASETAEAGTSDTYAETSDNNTAATAGTANTEDNSVTVSGTNKVSNSDTSSDADSTEATSSDSSNSSTSTPTNGVATSYGTASSGTNGTNTVTTDTPKTGDELLVGFAILALASATAIVVAIRKGKTDSAD